MNTRILNALKQTTLIEEKQKRLTVSLKTCHPMPLTRSFL